MTIDAAQSTKEVVALAAPPPAWPVRLPRERTRGSAGTKMQKQTHL